MQCTAIAVLRNTMQPTHTCKRCHARTSAPPTACPPTPCWPRRSTQVLTWAVIPVLQGYAISGAFSILGRLRSSLKRLWVFYLIIGAAAGAIVLLALAAGKLQLATLPALIFTLSNTYGGWAGGWVACARVWGVEGNREERQAHSHQPLSHAHHAPPIPPPAGLIVIIALLGYGLVEIPRILWRRSFPEARLKWHYHRVGRAADKLTDSSDELERVLAIVLATSQQIPRAEAKLRRFMDLIIK